MSLGLGATARIRALSWLKHTDCVEEGWKVVQHILGVVEVGLEPMEPQFHTTPFWKVLVELISQV